MHAPAQIMVGGDIELPLTFSSDLVEGLNASVIADGIRAIIGDRAEIERGSNGEYTVRIPANNIGCVKEIIELIAQAAREQVMKMGIECTVLGP